MLGHRILSVKYKNIEYVQHRLRKRLLCCCSLQYSKRLAKLGVDSLELRRLRRDLICVYKLQFGMVEADVGLGYLPFCTAVTY